MDVNIVNRNHNLGLILGIIFAYVYNKIPDKNAIIKGEIFGAILWLIFSVVVGLYNAMIFGLTYYMVSVALGIIPLIVFGYLLGVLYNKWNISTQPVTDTEFYKNE